MQKSGGDLGSQPGCKGIQFLWSTDRLTAGMGEAFPKEDVPVLGYGPLNVASKFQLLWGPLGLPAIARARLQEERPEASG